MEKSKKKVVLNNIKDTRVTKDIPHKIDIRQNSYPTKRMDKIWDQSVILERKQENKYITVKTIKRINNEGINSIKCKHTIKTKPLPFMNI